MNSKKNVVFLVAVSSSHDYLKEKHGDFKYFEFSINSWKYWCNYHLGIPQAKNEGAIRGTICHLIFELLITFLLLTF